LQEYVYHSSKTDLKRIRTKTYPGANKLLSESPIHHSSFETGDI